MTPLLADQVTNFDGDIKFLLGPNGSGKSMMLFVPSRRQFPGAKNPKSVAEVCGLKAGIAVTLRTLDNCSVLITPAASSAAVRRGPIKGSRAGIGQGRPLREISR